MIYLYVKVHPQRKTAIFNVCRLIMREIMRSSDEQCNAEEWP